MSPGDRITIHMHDTSDGLRIDLNDHTTHQTGSMTASIANGFGHILYQPESDVCHMEPYAFHPSTARGTRAATRGPRTPTTSPTPMRSGISRTASSWMPTSTARCPPTMSLVAHQTPTMPFCVPAEDSLLIKINGCFLDDEDFDGPSYQLDWPGTDPEPGRRTPSTTRRR